MNKRIDFLDFLRIYAFSSVLIGHKYWPALQAVSNDQSLHATIRLLAQIVSPFVWGGGAGVAVFFLVSGYIITHVIRTESTATFAIKRIFRIYPLFIAAVLIEQLLKCYVAHDVLPGWRVMIPRILLLGDLFGIPYALGSVEWTLRVELMFYAIMASLKLAGIVRRESLLSIAFFVITIAFQVLGPFPTNGTFATGYVTLYVPFLFAGGSFYLIEKRLSNRVLSIAFIGYAYLSYLVLLPHINGAAKESHFLTFALGIFFLAWKFRNHFHAGKTVVYLSNLTYSIYLFHNWAFDYLFSIGNKSAYINNLGHHAIALMLLLVLCSLTYFLIERPFVKLGAKTAFRYMRQTGQSRSGILS